MPVYQSFAFLMSALLVVPFVLKLKPVAESAFVNPVVTTCILSIALFTEFFFTTEVSAMKVLADE